ncbi:MAG: 2-phospho-L-lactate guanylyltransferase [Actinomycetota bacterium]
MLLAVIVPVKSFTVAKGRLASALDDSERETLARTCAERVVRAAAPSPVYVVCASDDIAGWAAALGARVVRQVSNGLNGAVHDGWRQAQADGADHVLVAHADLPLVTTFAHVPVEGEVTLVPDRHNDGTNVLSMPAGVDFVLHYGPGSFVAHLEEVNLRGLPHHVLHDDDLALDLDTADDLRELERRNKETT